METLGKHIENIKIQFQNMKDTISSFQDLNMIPNSTFQGLHLQKIY